MQYSQAQVDELCRQFGNCNPFERFEQLNRDAVAIKNDGNKLYGAQTYAEAAAKYQEGIELLSGYVVGEKLWWGYSDDIRVGAVMDTLGQLLNNRAACNLKLGNVRAVLRDTATSVHLVTCMRLIPELGLQPHHRTLLRASRTAQDVYVKAKVRRARAFELAGNAAAAAEIFTELVVGYQGSVPDDVHASYRAYLGHVLPSASLLAKDAYDWSLMYAGKWAQRQASGALPAVIRDFAAAHHAGHVYVVGGVSYQRGSMVPQYSSEVAALCLRTWSWRKVAFKGQGVVAGQLPGLRLPSTAVWRGHVVCFVGGPVVYLFDMAGESWSRKGAGGWPRPLRSSSVPAIREASDHEEFCYAVWSDTLYVFGGSTGHRDHSTLLALDLAHDSWRVVHHKEELGLGWPEGRHCAQMWAAGGKLYVFGGRTLGPAAPRGMPYNAMNDAMIGEHAYFWSYDIAAGTWRNEALALHHGAGTNMPGARSELPVATWAGGRCAALFGGYTTKLAYMPEGSSGVASYSYLADTYVYDAADNSWRYVYVESWPTYRAGGALVCLPGPGEEEGEEPWPGGSAGGSGKVMPGKLLALGGFVGELGFTRGGGGMPFDELWELSLRGSGPKSVAAMCAGCGVKAEGLKLCAGACGGAVAICGKECQAKVWQEGHKAWCKKVK